MSNTWRGLIFAVVLAALICGLIGLFDAVGTTIAIGVAVVGLILLWPETWPRLDIVLVRLLGAVAVAVLVLAGLNFLAFQVGLRHLPIWLGLILAVGVFGLVAYWYLQRAGWRKWLAGLVAGGLAGFLILGLPWILNKQDTDRVLEAKQVPSQLDVAIIGDGRRHRFLPPLASDSTLGEFDVAYSIGFAHGEEVTWTLLGESDPEVALEALAQGDDAPVEQGVPEPRPEADSILLLLVDGTAPVSTHPASLAERKAIRRGEVGRWRRIAAEATPGASAFALLQTTDKRRLRRWEEFGPAGSVFSIQELGSQSVTDTAVQLASSAPTSPVDQGLALAFRPILLFDGEEGAPWPLAIGPMFRNHLVKLCREELTADCGEPLDRAAELESGGTHLELDLPSSTELQHLAQHELEAYRGEREPPARPKGIDTAIYVHPVSLTREGQNLLYLDYWWYLPENPVEVGGGILCGAGFVIPGVTCLSHQSDWEGMTVVVDRTGPEPKILAVHYAQHDSVVRYGWDQLRTSWEGNPRVQRLVAGIEDASTRPVVFVAKGTHASYPIPCSSDCKQMANPDLGEGPYYGGRGWIGNYTDACLASSCVELLPTRVRGTEPALWNAYDGPWGKRSCLLAYCDSGSPPPAPGQQDRYEDPTVYDEKGKLRASP
jgi:hypothetical protein